MLFDMPKQRLSLFAIMLLSGIPAAYATAPDNLPPTAIPAHSDVAAGVQPPIEVRDAVSRLRTACEAWVQPPRRMAGDKPEWHAVQPEALVCEAADHPDRGAKTLLWCGGLIGMLLTIVALAVFSLLRFGFTTFWEWRSTRLRIRNMARSRAFSG